MQRFGKRRTAPTAPFRGRLPIPPTVRVMLRFSLISLLVSLAGTAGAETFDRAERPCHAELLRGAYAVCLSYVAEQRDAAMEARIASTLSGLQAARPAELQALAIRYRDAQAAWRVAVEEGCDDDDVVFVERCRLAAVLEREAEVAESLTRAAADLGGWPETEIALPDAVEVLISLQLPPGVGTGDEIVSVPLWVPVLP